PLVLSISLALPTTTLFPYTTLFRSNNLTTKSATTSIIKDTNQPNVVGTDQTRSCSLTSLIPSILFTTQNKLSLKMSKSNFSSGLDRKSTRLNSSHVSISYAVFCLTK